MQANESQRESRNFLNYFEKRGLSEEHVERAGKFLMAFYHSTGKEWFPGNCNNVPSLVGDANRALAFADLKDFGKFNAMHFKRVHYFLVSPLQNGRMFIADPAGRSKEGKPGEKVIPYFGLLESARGNHRKAYDAREPI